MATPPRPTAAAGPRPAGFNTKSPTIKRILQESRELSLCPDPTLTASPLETNLFEWHFTLTGPPSTPYAQGIYHGRIVLPTSYPLRPPSFRFLTPSGRFEVNREICLSISGHHEETWQPAWGIRTALCAIRAFMAGDAKGQVGGLDMGAEGRERLARESRGWRCAGCGGRSNEEVMREVEAEWKEQHQGEEVHAQGEVPEELRLAFREDLEAEGKGKGEATAGAVKSEATVEDEENNNRAAAVSGPGAAGGVSEAPLIPQRSATTSGTPAPAAQLAARPASQTVGGARQRVTMVATSGHPATQRQDAVPAWVDKAIVGIFVTLIVMLLKKYAGREEY